MLLNIEDLNLKKTEKIVNQVRMMIELKPSIERVGVAAKTYDELMRKTEKRKEKLGLDDDVVGLFSEAGGRRVELYRLDI